MVSRRTASAGLTAAIGAAARIAIRPPNGSVKMRELAEESEALIDLLSRERFHAFRPKTLHRKGTHYAAIKHSVLKSLQRHLRLRGKIPEEPSGKGIARARGIYHLIQRQCGGTERQRQTALAGAVKGLVAEER